MESFVNNTEVSFSQLAKKDGWFSRLIFFQLVVIPTLTLFYWVLMPVITTVHLVSYGISIAGSLTIGFLLWKNRTRLTITVSIILLWILFLHISVSPFLGAVVLLFADLYLHGANNSLINNRIGALIYTIIFAVIALVLTVIWTRNLRKLKQLQP